MSVTILRGCMHLLDQADITKLLQDSLGGQAKTLMFVHISPEPDADGETISTVKFAEQFPKVELGAARVNKDSANAKELKEQIGTLKAALARKEENQRTCNIHFPTVLKDREQKPVSYRLKVKAKSCIHVVLKHATKSSHIQN
ncbi:unnamed protein product, partial [Vitis vinifera]